MRKAAALLAASLLIPAGYDCAAPIRRSMEVRMLLTRVACQLGRSWCGSPASGPSANFEGEDVESRLARRKRNWIADVRFVSGTATTPALRATPPQDEEGKTTPSTRPA